MTTAAASRAPAKSVMMGVWSHARPVIIADPSWSSLRSTGKPYQTASYWCKGHLTLALRTHRLAAPGRAARR
jgi:hypothetical protein